MKTTVGLVVGIAVGVCIGMLIAPEKGSETRKKLADSAEDWMEKLRSFFAAEEEENSGPGSKAYKQTPRTTT